MKPLITIDDFTAGIISDPTKPAKNAFNFISGLDIHRESGILQVSQALTAVTGTFTDLVKWIVRDDNETTYKYWALGDTGKLYKSTDGSSWSLDSSLGGTGHGLAVYNGERWYCTDSALVGSTSGSNAIDSDTNWHPLQVYLGSLHGGAGRYIFKMESDGTFTKRKLTLPADDKVKSLRVYGDRLDIGTWRGTNIYDTASAYLFAWNGTDDFPNESFWLEECGMNAMETWENVLLILAGIGGNVWVFNNAFLDKAHQIPKIEPEAGNYMYAMSGAVCQFQGNCLVGISNGSGSGVGGVYTFGRKTEDLPFAMTLSHPISTGNTDIQIGATFPIAINKFLISWKDGASYGMDIIDTSNKYSSGYVETQEYEIAEGSEKKLVKGIAIVAEPLPSGTSITVQYDADDSGSYSSAGTITSSNQDEVLYFTTRAKIIQLKFTLNASSNNSPKIKRIEIY